MVSIVTLIGSVLVIGNRPINNLIEYDENTTLALFDENGNEIESVPSKDSGYTLDTKKSSCTNGSISWNTESWSPIVTVNSEVNGRVTCNLYFKEANAYDECISKYGEDSIQCSILADVDDTGCPFVSDEGTIGATFIENTNGYLCSAPDDYGTSYYYRGTVSNNYVKFGQNEQGQDMYWRIIRINGDESMRLIYYGTSIDEASSIGVSIYNQLDAHGDGDNAHVGYMYGSIAASTYEQTHANIHDSTLKEYIDNWYKTVFLDTIYENYLTDTLFCNDRSISKDDLYGTGIANSDTSYRWYNGLGATSAKPSPTLICKEQNDRFTVSDEVVGNGDLTYPIATISADEIHLYANPYDDKSYFLTMTPSEFVDGRKVYIKKASLAAGVDDIPVASYEELDVRPVINLKPNSLVSGDGTADNPYSVI